MTRTVLGSDGWNENHRGEQPLARADRNFIELLQELRVVFTGVQILLGFLLTASFSERFVSLDRPQLTAFVVTLVCAVVSSVLLVAPVAAHRMAFQRGRKQDLVRWGHHLAIAGLGFLGLTIASGLLLVLDLAVGRVIAYSAAGVLLLATGVLWWAIPFVGLRRSPPTPARPVRMTVVDH